MNLEIHGEAESADAGVWKVRPIAALLGKDAGKFQLELPKGELTVRIKKRPLTIPLSASRDLNSQRERLCRSEDL